MISKQAIKEFLAIQHEGWDWLKDYPEEELLSEIKDKFTSYKWKTFKSFKHQLVMLLLGIEHPNFLFFADMGAGKTKTLLEILSYYKVFDPSLKTLVICPTSAIVSWADEILIHSDFTYTELLGGKKSRKDLLTRDTDLYLINYQGLQVFMTDMKKKRSKNKSKHKRVTDVELVETFAKNFDMIIWDEINFIKNPESLVFELSFELSERVHLRYGLTGTPFGKDPMDLWSQFYVIDHGETLHNNLHFFKNAFFIPEQGFWGGIDWKFDKRKKNRLKNKLGNKSIRYNEKEMNDLPPCTEKVVHYNMSEEQINYYRQAYGDFIKAQGHVLEKGNSFIRARTICSGFLEFKDQEGEKQVIYFKDNPKLELLIEMVQSTPEDSKIVVIKEYIRSGEIICDRLKKEKIKYSLLDGTVKDKTKAIKTFQEDPKCKVFVVNALSGAFSLNLQMANYQFFYESPTSPIIRRQAEKRVNRTGQKKHVFIYDLTARRRVEDQILESHREGKDLFKNLLDWKEVFV